VLWQHRIRIGLFLTSLVLLGGGCGGGDRLLSNQLLPGDLTVVAKVLDLNDTPLPNIAVWIDGRGPYVTDREGSVEVDQVRIPYHAIVVDGFRGTADVWLDLTRPDPVFGGTRMLDDDSLILEASVEGLVTGGIGWPVPITHETQVSSSFEDALAWEDTEVDATSGAYSLPDLDWYGAFFPTLHLVAMQYEVDVDGNATDYTGWGELTIPIEPNDVLMNQDIVMDPVETTTVAGTLDLPTGLYGYGALGFVRLPSGGFHALPSQTEFSDTFSIRMPVVEDVSRGILILAVDPVLEGFVYVVHEGLAAPTTDLRVDVPPPTSLVLPIEGALGVTYDTLFVVTPAPGGRVFAATFRPVADPGPTITLHTAASEFSIPDLSGIGLGIPAGTNYQWSVSARGPFGSLDEAAAAGGPPVYYFPIARAASGDFMTWTGSREFTFTQ